MTSDNNIDNLNNYYSYNDHNDYLLWSLYSENPYEDLFDQTNTNLIDQPNIDLLDQTNTNLIDQPNIDLLDQTNINIINQAIIDLLDQSNIVLLDQININPNPNNISYIKKCLGCNLACDKLIMGNNNSERICYICLDSKDVCYGCNKCIEKNLPSCCINCFDYMLRN